MNRILLSLLCWAAPVFWLFAEQVPEGFGQLSNPPALIPGGVEDSGLKYSYLAQSAENRKLILTASNGFFNPGAATAKGESNLPKVGDTELIVPNFEYLEWRQPNQSLRWHLLIAGPGKVYLRVHLESDETGREIEVALGDQVQTVRTAKVPADQAQPWDLAFDVAVAGEYPISLTARGDGGIGKLYHIDVFGPAIEGSHLLRVRWRPAAAHGSYRTDEVADAKLLVFTTRSLAPISSYSPITTPFGYYGTSFEDDRRSAGFLNFSMWGQEDAGDRIELMPHLIGVGSPEGEFSGFGHEGSGVKPRGWTPMPDRPELVVQALRVENGEKYDHYFGYFFDHPTATWKFFAAGKKWHGGKPVSNLRLGSFCEVPGPPQSQRTGDLYREVRRRAWAWDGEIWQAIDGYEPGGTGSSGDEPVNKRWYTTETGEYAMGCGGIRLYHHEESYVEAHDSVSLPEFLRVPSVERLFGMPVTFPQIQVSEVSADRALVEVEMLALDPITTASLYFGKTDALTFAPRELHGTERNSELSTAINSQSWESVVEGRDRADGIYQFELSGLEPATEYFFRVLAANQVSQIWTDPSLSFTTLANGEPTQTKARLQLSEQAAASSGSKVNVFADQEYRSWTYRVGDREVQVEAKLLSINRSGEIELERSGDRRKASIEIELLSPSDREYLDQLR
ncbi:MAG: fibronectin type III domain-containing protein [Verrucomicrobiota bacterium]